VKDADSDVVVLHASEVVPYRVENGYQGLLVPCDLMGAWNGVLALVRPNHPCEVGRNQDASGVDLKVIMDRGAGVYCHHSAHVDA